MPIVKISVTSTKFLDELKRRSRAFKTARIAARIQVPTDLSWWYFLEFGTATRTLADAPYGVRARPYPIKPIDRGNAGTLQVLHWGPQGGGTFVHEVKAHPGIRPHPFVRQSIPQIMRVFARDVAAGLLKDGFQTSSIKRALLEGTMVYAKALLVQNLSTAAPGTREDGNLLGNTAASVFEEEAEIVEASDFSPTAESQFQRRREANRKAQLKKADF